MRKKRWVFICVGILVYVLLLFILCVSESKYRKVLIENKKAQTEAYREGDREEELLDSDSVIDTPFEAIWYSVTTLTTVGYGDLYPRSPVGKLIGLIFMLFSLGLLAYLITIFLARARTRFFPRIMLYFLRRKYWYLFDGYTAESAVIARNLKKEYPECVVLFFGTEDSKAGEVPEGSRVVFSAEELLRFRKKGQEATIFYISKNQAENYSQAIELRAEDCKVCCMTEYEPQMLPNHVTLFNPFQCCARLYWKEHPVISPKEKIVFIGDGKYCRALLEQALMINVFAPGQQVSYTVFGSAGNFRETHPLFARAMETKGEEDFLGDSLVFSEQSCQEELDILGTATRIILCEDDEELALDHLCELRRFCAVTGEIHIRTSVSFPGVLTFGNVQEIFTPELVLRQKLNRAAIALHNIYREEYPAIPAWENLDNFKQYSNFAAADHLDVKARILLGEDAKDLAGFERYRKAYAAYLASREENGEVYRQIEHARWLRVYLLYNWRYAPVRDDSRRLHPLMRPYGQLPEEERVKNDGPWEILEFL